MELKEAICERRSIRKYKSDAIEKEKIANILAVAIQNMLLVAHEEGKMTRRKTDRFEIV